jgi:hypothetical protein
VLLRWWASLSGESKAAIIAAIVGPCAVEILGLRAQMMRLFYIRTLERLADAKVQLHKEAQVKWHFLTIDNEDDDAFYPLERVAKKAGVWKWRARWAMRWKNRIKEYGELMH